jgi:hypothetical protein
MTMRYLCSFVAGIAILLCASATLQAGDTPAPEGANVYIISPGNGDKVSSPVKVIFGLSGMGVAPAGVETENTGHHHLIIDEKIEGDELNQPIPSDDKHKHFGKGQTETSVEVGPGKRTLQLVLGDAGHIPNNPPVMSEIIIIEVQ